MAEFTSGHIVDTAGNAQVTQATGLDSTNDSISAHTDGYSYKYQAAASADVVVKASPGYLKGIIVGKYIANATIEVSDHASDGDGNVMAFLTLAATNVDSFPKYIPVECYFATGITVDQLLATQVTYIYR
jgi:hypothetical protein